MFQKNVDFVETRSFLKGYKDRGSAASGKTLIVIGVYRTTGLQKSLSSLLIKSYNTQIQKSIKKLKQYLLIFNEYSLFEQRKNYISLKFQLFATFLMNIH